MYYDILGYQLPIDILRLRVIALYLRARMYYDVYIINYYNIIHAEHRRRCYRLWSLIAFTMLQIKSSRHTRRPHLHSHSHTLSLSLSHTHTLILFFLLYTEGIPYIYISYVIYRYLLCVRVLINSVETNANKTYII